MKRIIKKMVGSESRLIINCNNLKNYHHLDDSGSQFSAKNNLCKYSR